MKKYSIKAGARKTAPFYSSKAEIKSLMHSKEGELESIHHLAFLDKDFLLSPELKAVRLLLEFLKCELQIRKNHTTDIVTVFGSARIIDPISARNKVTDIKKKLEKFPKNLKLKKNLQQAKIKLKNSAFYQKAHDLGALLSEIKIRNHKISIATGGGPGIMEAANRGAKENGHTSIGMSIVLPFEQRKNYYVDSNLSFYFHYFAIRKMHMLQHCRALIIFPGGFGTLDELFEVLTLISTHKMKAIPVILLGKKFWKKVINFKALYEKGMISKKDLSLFKIFDSIEHAISYINNFYKKTE